MNRILYSEAKLAEMLNMPRRDITELRRAILETVEDFTLVGNYVAYTEKGLRKAVNALDAAEGYDLSHLMDKTRLTPTGEPDSAKNAGPPDQILLCCGVASGNRQIVLARFIDIDKAPTDPDFTDYDGRVRVKVRSNQHFIPGMEMNCRWIQTDLWELIGRCPRSRGRW